MPAIWEVLLPLTAEKATAVDHFHEMMQRDPSGRYVVSLPHKNPVPVIGESMSMALRRYHSNKCSLEQKGTWKKFETAV